MFLPKGRKSSHYYLYSTFNDANCVKAALHQLDIKLSGFTSALQYLHYLGKKETIFSSTVTLGQQQECHRYSNVHIQTAGREL